jgi:aminopeptidase YwaD
MPYVYTDLIRATYRGEMAHRHVAAISAFHRIQASPGYRAAANYVAAQLSDAGLQVRVLGYQADGATRFWSSPSFLEWNCEGATLHLLRTNENGGARLLCDFNAVPISLIQRSVPVEGEFEVVAPGGKGGIVREDFAGLDVAGKIVLTSRPVARVAAVAIGELGAAGILFDGMEAGGRTELDLPDALQYTSFWWGGDAEPDAWGFVLSPRAGRELRTRLAKGETLRVRAAIDSEFYPGAIEVVEALLPGDAMADGEEILLVSHLCHPRPGAHDNASGAAALLEAAVSLARLVSDGRLPAPRRSIRFIWPPEMTGTYAYLAEAANSRGSCDEGRAGYHSPWLAGLNLDMVGADQEQTGGQWELVDLPQAAASFADHLLAWLREPFLSGVRHTETPFSAGSDHYILSDPTVGIPAPMIIHWPDKFYHTSEDTPEKVTPDSLARSGALAAIYAYWLASAGAADAEWLGHWMVARFGASAARAAAEVVESARAATGQSGASWRRYARLSGFRCERMQAALADLARIDPGAGARVPGWQARVADIEERERRWAEEAFGAPAATDAHEPEPPWLARAKGLYPCRLGPGPIDVGMVLSADHPELLPQLWELHDRLGPVAHNYEPVLQYWADGTRSVAEIGELADLELDHPADENTLAYFELLAETGHIRLDRRTANAGADVSGAGA